MAQRDYRFVGYEDEKDITEVMLRALPKVCKARVDREAWLDSLALSTTSGSNNIRVQGGDDIVKTQQFVEAKEADKTLGLLKLIEVRLCDKIQHLSKVERAVVREYFLSEDGPTDAEVGRRLGVSKYTVKTIRLRARDKLIRACTSVYHHFCLWREKDEIELDRRRSVRLDSIMKEEEGD